MDNNLENYSQYCFVACATDVGKKRAANEDYLGKADTPNGRVVVVCDGMGGHVGGATASHIAVETILDFMRENFRNDPREAVGEAIDAANRSILEHARTHPELAGMGSTCVLLLVRNGKVYIGHVGDSRIYLVRSKTIHQLTVDHSYVQELVNAGAITKDEAEHHPRKNEITNALGIPNMKPATVRDEAISPEAGDVFLLCSDGLSNMVDDRHIAHIASNFEMTTQQRANTLVQRANDNGGLDNITCALVEFSAKPDTVSKVPFWKKKPAFIGAIASVVLICGVVAWQLFKNPEPKNEEFVPTSSIETNNSGPVEITVEEQPPSKGLENEKIDLGVISIKEEEEGKLLLIVSRESLRTTIKDAKEKVIKTVFQNLDLTSIKYDFNYVTHGFYNESNTVKLELTEPAKKLKNKLNGKTISFTLQNETIIYEFSFKVNVVADEPGQVIVKSTTDTVNSNLPLDTINVDKDDYLIALYHTGNQPKDTENKKLIPINNVLSINEYEFDAESIQKKENWYEMKIDGNLCEITIPKKDMIPSDASIQLTIKSGNDRNRITLPIVKSK